MLMDVLLQIKRLVLQRNIEFTFKARQEMFQDGLSADEVVESIINAQSIAKVVRSKSTRRRHSREKLYVIRSFSFGGTLIYTKGTIAREKGRDVFYIFISAKVDLRAE
jgi:hypothetical protein